MKNWEYSAKSHSLFLLLQSKMKTLDLAAIQQINLFENVTHSRVKDLFVINNETCIFIVEPGDLDKAIGRGGINIKKLTSLLRKRIKVVEFNPDVLLFFTSLLYPLKPESIEKKEGTLAVTADTKTKALLIGRDRRNFIVYSRILKAYFNLALTIR